MTRTLSRILFVVTLSMLLGGCGGSTEGTGGITINGRVLNVPDAGAPARLAQADGPPLVGVIVTIAETGDSAVTDQAGDFEIKTALRDSYELIFDKDRLSARATISGVPKDTSTIRAEFDADPNRNRASVKNLTFERRPQIGDKHPAGPAAGSGQGSGSSGGSGGSGGSAGSGGSGGSMGSGGSGGGGGSAGSGGQGNGGGSGITPGAGGGAGSGDGSSGGSSDGGGSGNGATDGGTSGGSDGSTQDPTGGGD